MHSETTPLHTLISYSGNLRRVTNLGPGIFGYSLEVGLFCSHHFKVPVGTRVKGCIANIEHCLRMLLGYNMRQLLAKLQ